MPPHLAVSDIRRMFDVDPEKGDLYWRERPRSDFASDAAHVRFNRTKPGTKAGCLTPSGYVVVTFYQVGSYGLHRLIWAHVQGRHPSGQIDHINGDRSDNRLANLRDVTALTNRRNMAISRRNKSGRMGVFFDKRDRRWRAYIIVKKQTINLGYFATFDEAAVVRKAAEVRYGFHENHGRPNR